MAQTKKESVPTRMYAHIFDQPIQGDPDQHAVDRSPDAIGGAYGIGWYEYFRDHQTGENYRVNCSDGVNGGKGSLSPADLTWSQKCYNHIRSRTEKEADAEITVRMSSNEWAIMCKHTFYSWLDDTEDCSRVRSQNHGPVGTIKGTLVRVDPTKEDDLPPRDATTRPREDGLDLPDRDENGHGVWEF